MNSLEIALFIALMIICCYFFAEILIWWAQFY
jgi:hypothetical protein